MVKTRKQKRKTRKQRGGTFFNVWFKNRQAKGNSFSVNESKNTPRVNFKGSGLYTFIMWDPDAPAKSWLHWLVVNAEEGDVKKGEVLMPYSGPNPPSGLHHYYIAVYSQKGPLQIDAPQERGYFNLENFIQEHNLLEVAKTSLIVEKIEGNSYRK